jgi:hypothetical protein
MTDERNPQLERFFAEAERELADEAFVEGVMAKTGKWSVRGVALVLAVCLVAAPVAWLVAAPVNEALHSLLQLVTQPLVATGSGIASGVVLPLNSVGGALALSLIALRALMRRLFSRT